MKIQKIGRNVGSLWKVPRTKSAYSCFILQQFLNDFNKSIFLIRVQTKNILAHIYQHEKKKKHLSWYHNEKTQDLKKFFCPIIKVLINITNGYNYGSIINFLRLINQYEPVKFRNCICSSLSNIRRHITDCFFQ